MCDNHGVTYKYVHYTFYDLDMLNIISRNSFYTESKLNMKANYICT